MLFYSVYAEDFICKMDNESYRINMTDKYLEITDDYIGYSYKAFYEARNVNGIRFITFVNTINGFPWLSIGRNECMVLVSKNTIYIYVKDKKEPVFFAIDDKIARDSKDFLLTATSYLNENKQTYLPSNLGIYDLDSPWVEGVEGSGINQEITIEPKDQSKIWYIYLSNGYVSFKRPDLYEKNNRVKSVSVFDENMTLLGKYDLLDSPDPQQINWKKEISKVKIRIDEVYKGTKYDDTCINFIEICAW
jgi:hypothetical protein